MSVAFISNLDTESLRDEVVELISLGTEGDFWDFKAEWHKDDGDLIFDIICLANSRENRDKYLIVGVADQKDIEEFRQKGSPVTAENPVIGVSKHTKNREQIDIVQLLRRMKWANDRIPDVRINTICLENCNNESVYIDVLVIKNSDYTPYYLTKDVPMEIREVKNCGKLEDEEIVYHDFVYKKIRKYNKDDELPLEEGVAKTIRAGVIYSRIMDANSAWNSVADFSTVELLWKKRFGIDKIAIERVKTLLRSTEHWHPLGTDGIHSSNKNYGKWFNGYYPEFTICHERNDSWPKGGGGGINLNDQEYYWLTELDKVPEFHDFSIFDIEVKMHSTSLFSGRMIMDCNGKYCRMWWKKALLFSGSKLSVYYAYVERDSIEFLLDDFWANCQETIPNIENHEFVSSVDEFRKYCYTDKPYNIIPVFQNSFERKSFQEYVESRRDDFLREIGTWTKSDAKTGEAFDTNKIEWLCKVGGVLVSWLATWRNLTVASTLS
jgi:hypothetical protein